jgi:hypothetical protein
VPSNDPREPLGIPLQGVGVQSSPPPVPTVSTTGTLGNQNITLTTPAANACVVSPSRLTVRLAATTRTRGTKTRFSRAAFYIDRGVKHRHRTRAGTKISYRPNATARRLPASVSLSVARLKPGTHTLKVVVSYKESKTSHGVRRTAVVSKTLRVKFAVCS